MNSSDTNSECPVCGKHFPSDEIEIHVNRCIFLNTKTEAPKRTFSVFNSNSSPVGAKKLKLAENVKRKDVSKSKPTVEKTPIIDIDDEENVAAVS